LVAAAAGVGAAWKHSSRPPSSGNGVLDDALVELSRKRYHPSLYCWAFTMGTGEEPLLLVKQMQHNWGIFACEEHVVYSSKTKVMHGMHTVGLGHNPTHSVKKGFSGDGFAVNSLIFIKAWRHILKVKKYMHHAWTVKVDADSVFFPGWLKRKLAYVRHDRQVLVYNLPKKQAWLGQRLHGAIEVLSRPALKRLARDGRKHPNKCLIRHHEGGEDGWLFNCFHKTLHVPGHFIHDMVHFRFPDNDFEKCVGGAVVFHPMKTPDAWEKCHSRALAHGY